MYARVGRSRSRLHLLFTHMRELGLPADVVARKLNKGSSFAL